MNTYPGQCVDCGHSQLAHQGRDRMCLVKDCNCKLTKQLTLFELDVKKPRILKSTAYMHSQWNLTRKVRR